MELMKSLSNKYHVETVLRIQHKTIRCFDFVLIAGQKLTIVFHAEFQNWHWSRLSVTSCKISSFEMKRALWGASRHNWGPFMWQSPIASWASVRTQHWWVFIFAPSLLSCPCLWLSGVSLVGEQKDAFQTMKYTGVVTSFTQQGNQINESYLFSYCV